MFATSQPVKIVVNKRPEMSAAEYQDQQVRVCVRACVHVRVRAFQNAYFSDYSKALIIPTKITKLSPEK